MRFVGPFGLVLGVVALAAPAVAERRGPAIAPAGLATTVAPTPAPMSLRLGRTAGEPECGAPCATFIVAEGDIRRETGAALSALLKALPRPVPVYLASPGGSLEGALALGHLLRSHGAEVIVARRDAVAQAGAVTVYADAPRPARCLSACVYAFAGGAIRRVPDGSDLGVHQFFVASPDDPARRPRDSYSRADVAHVQKTVAMLAGYIAGMGIGIDLLSIAADTDPAAIRSLTRQELAALGLEATRADFAAPPPAPPMPHEAARGFAPPPPAAEAAGSFVVLRTKSNSRRFGPIASELTLRCGEAADRYRAAFAEIVPGRTTTGDAVAVVGPLREAARLSPEGVILRRSALDAALRGTLDIEVTSQATAGYPMRLSFAGEDVAAAIARLDRGCPAR